MGTNTINVYPGKGFGDRKSDKVKTLTVADSEILGKQSYIASATPSQIRIIAYMGPVSLFLSDRNTPISINGAESR